MGFFRGFLGFFRATAFSTPGDLLIDDFGKFLINFGSFMPKIAKKCVFFLEKMKSHFVSNVL